MVTTRHVPVLRAAVCEWLSLPTPGILVDGTLGGAGHARALLEASHPKARLVAFDRDSTALLRAATALRDLPERVASIQVGTIEKLTVVMKELGVAGVDRLLLDLGYSSDQIEDSSRGFGFLDDGPLDMRYNLEQSSLTAKEIVNRWNEQELTDIFSRYGEFAYSKGLARSIVAARTDREFVSTVELAQFVFRYASRRGWRRPIHPATQVFQALRIAVNNELDVLDAGLSVALSSLVSEGGRAGVISFHSLEDRRVKHAFQKAVNLRCVCPPQSRGCRCERRFKFRLLIKKPIVANATELGENPRSRSAKFRVIERYEV